MAIVSIAITGVLGLFIFVMLVLAIERKFNKPDQQWLQDLLTDVHNLKDQPMLVELTYDQWVDIGRGVQVALPGPIIVTLKEIP